MREFSGRRFIALALSLILFAAVFAWDMPSSFAEEPPAESPAPTQTVEPEPAETPVESPLPSEASTEEPSEIPIPSEEIQPELPGDIQLAESADESAQQMEPCATSGDYDYADNGDGTVTITRYHGSSVTVKIPSVLDGFLVSAIGENAFFNNLNIGDVTIPSSVRMISTGAFANCYQMARVDIQNGTTCIGANAFAGCTMLRSVNLPTSLTTIQANAFYNCTMLKDITIPASVINIGKYAFSYCTNLSKAYFLGNAPILNYDIKGPVIGGLGVFDYCSPNFTIYYINGNTGFTNPWYGYPTAVFDPNNTHTITIYPANGQPEYYRTVGCGVYINAPDVPTNKGWEFVGWVVGGTNASLAEFPYQVFNDTSFTAKYIPVESYLSNVQLTAGSLSRAFMPLVYKYKINLGENEPSVTITPIKYYYGSSMTINGKAVSSTTVSLANGKSKTVTIKLKLGKKSSTYKFTVTRAKSGDNNLASLTNTAGVLSQPFDANVTNYTLNLDENTSSVTIKAEKSNAMAKVSPASKKLTLKNGQTKVLKFTVKAQSGAKKTYTVTVTRAPSTNTNLKTLKTSVPLSPGFSAGATDYTLTLPADKGAVTVSAKAFDKLSKVTINGAKKSSQKITLANGQSTMVSVVVTSQAGTTRESGYWSRGRKRRGST